MSFGEILCLWLPWHRWSWSRQLSKWSWLAKCDHCGREWATNLDTEITIPFHMVRSQYIERR